MPLVRLFVPSEEDENTLLNLAELIGLESDKQEENQEEEEEFAGYTAFSITTIKEKLVLLTAFLSLPTPLYRVFSRDQP